MQIIREIMGSVGQLVGMLATGPARLLCLGSLGGHVKMVTKISELPSYQRRQIFNNILNVDILSNIVALRLSHGPMVLRRAQAAGCATSPHKC